MITRPAFVGLSAFFFAVAVHPVFWVGVVIMVFDCRARYQEYKYIRNKKFSELMCSRFGHSWCGRGVCEYVWPEQAAEFFFSRGYRWYHILPDGFPGVFFRLDFWKHVVGVK